MADLTAPVRALFDNPRFPRASRYDPGWVATNQMGPNALWLVEWLCEAVALHPGMRVLDLGCGRAMTSVYLAREHDVSVFATDLWIPAAENWRRVCEAGVGDRVVPIQAEAHALPFAAGFFDAILALDSYAYFGTDDLYLSYLLRFLRPGGTLGIVVPGLVAELDGPPPPHLLSPQRNGRVFWEPDCCCFHSPQWWRRHWERTGLVSVDTADLLADGWRHWAQHERALEAAGLAIFPSDAEALEADAGRHVGLVRVVARRAAHDGLAGPHAWEPAFAAVYAALHRAAEESVPGAVAKRR